MIGGDAAGIVDTLAQGERLSVLRARRGDIAAIRTDTSQRAQRIGLDPHIATGRFKHSEPQPPAPRGPVPRDATAKQRMARKLRTKRGRAVYARRKAIVEPVFGQIDTVQDGRRLLLRGEQAARDQWRFHCAVHNLLKLHRAGGLDLIREQEGAAASPGPARPTPCARPAALARTLAARLRHLTAAARYGWIGSALLTDTGS